MELRAGGGREALRSSQREAGGAQLYLFCVAAPVPALHPIPLFSPAVDSEAEFGGGKPLFHLYFI